MLARGFVDAQSTDQVVQNLCSEAALRRPSLMLRAGIIRFAKLFV
jgi:hypothetical protein